MCIANRYYIIIENYTLENSIHLKDEKTDTILRSFHQSNLLIPGRHIQLINAIGQGCKLHYNEMNTIARTGKTLQTQ